MSKITSVLFCDLFHKLGLRLHLGGRAVEFLTIKQEYIMQNTRVVGEGDGR